MVQIIKVCDVKIGAAHMAEIAKAMNCTPKALTHRLAHFRKMGAISKATTDAVKPAKVTKATAAPKRRVGAGKKAQAEINTRTPSPNGDDEEPLTPPATARGKRDGAKKNYAEKSDDEDDGMNDKVKIEVGEDIGEGLRQGVDDEEI